MGYKRRSECNRADRDKSICLGCRVKIKKVNGGRYSNPNLDSRAKRRNRNRSNKIDEGNLESVIYRRLHLASHRAKKKKIEFNLTYEYMLRLYEEQGGKCYYSGLKLCLKRRGAGCTKDYSINNLGLITIDRKDPNLGYVEGNVVWCTYIINTMKAVMNEVEFDYAIKYLYNYRTKRIGDMGYTDGMGI